MLRHAAAMPAVLPDAAVLAADGRAVGEGAVAAPAVVIAGVAKKRSGVVLEQQLRGKGTLVVLTESPLACLGALEWCECRQSHRHLPKLVVEGVKQNSSLI